MTPVNIVIEAIVAPYLGDTNNDVWINLLDFATITRYVLPLLINGISTTMIAHKTW
jgi:hypothetical protein